MRRASIRSKRWHAIEPEVMLNAFIRFPRTVAAAALAAIAVALPTLLTGCVSSIRHAALLSPEIPARWATAPEADGERPGSPRSGQSEAAPDEVAIARSFDVPAGQWWHAFGDGALNTLVETALTNNADLALAAIRVRRAQLEAGLVGARIGPQASLTAAADVTRAFDADRARVSTGVNAALSFELDLWGKLAARRDEAAWRTQATEADREAAALLLVGTTAKLYWRIGYLNESIALGDASIADALRTVDMVQARVAAGAATPVDAARARQQLAVLRAEQANARLERQAKRNALTWLLNRPPGASGEEPQGVSGAQVPAVRAGLPARVLARRPDLRAAQSRLRARLANVDFARAAMYPDLSLTAELGTSSDRLIRTLQNPVASIGAAIALPFVQWNAVRLKAALSENEFEEATVDFRKTLYGALADVETALAGKVQLDAEAEQRKRALEDAALAATLARTRFEWGATDAAPWLDAQRAQRSAQLDRVTNQLARLENRVDLFLALGGG